MGGKEGKRSNGEGEPSGPLMACSRPQPCTLGWEVVSEPERYTVGMFAWRYYLLILKSGIPSFVKMAEALAPLHQLSRMAPMGGGPALGVEGFGS